MLLSELTELINAISGLITELVALVVILRAIKKRRILILLQ